MRGYIGLGSNLGDRWANLRRGVAGLREAGVAVDAVSSVWESEPIDTDAPLWFLNMAVGVDTERHPLALLGLLLGIEREAGRERGARNAPRTLDLDLLVLGDLEWQDGRLRLPHPRMWQRRFVLEPLSEIAPDLRDPATGQTVAEAQRRVCSEAVVFKVGSLGAC